MYIIGLWDEEDEFYYDELNLPDGKLTKLKIRSMVGLIPHFAVETLEPETLDRLPGFDRRLRWTLTNRPDLCKLVSRWQEPSLGERRLLSLLRGSRMKKLLRRMLDETEFLSPYGVRALSRVHLQQPYVFPRAVHLTRSTMSLVNHTRLISEETPIGEGRFASPPPRAYCKAWRFSLQSLTRTLPATKPSRYDAQAASANREEFVRS